MEKKLIKKTVAAVMAFALLGGAVCLPAGERTLLGNGITANAEDIKNFSFDEGSGVLTVFGDYSKWSREEYDAFRRLKNNSEVKKIVASSDFVLPESCYGLFSSFLATEINLSGADFSNVKDMTEMFKDCKYLSDLDLTCFNTSKVEDMSGMFQNCSQLQELDFSRFDTSNVTRMSSMFDGCRRLKELDLHTFNTANVTFMPFMFAGCEYLESVDLSNFNTSKVVGMGSMFSGCKSLVSLDLKHFDTSNVTLMDNMFNNCINLEKLNVDSFNTEKVWDMDNMFYNCKKLSYVNLTGFTTEHLKWKGDINKYAMYHMLTKCDSLSPTAFCFDGSLFLTGDININFDVTFDDSVTKIVISGPNGDAVYDTSDGKYYKNNCWLFYPVHPSQIHEPVILRAYDAEGKQAIMTQSLGGLHDHCQVKFSVEKYIAEIKKEYNTTYEADTELPGMISALENFCLAADNYFNNGTNTIEGIDNVKADDVKDYAPTFGDNLKLSLVLNSSTALRLYTESSNVLIDGKKADAKTKNDKKYYEISDIFAQALGDQHTITIDGTEYKFSPMSYVYRVLNNTNASPELVDMAKATYVYYKTAESYLGANN